MRLFKGKNNQPTAEDYAQLGAVDQMFENYYVKVKGWPSGKRRALSVMLFALIAAGTALAVVFDLHRWIQVGIGVPLGLGLFAFVLGFTHLRNKAKEEADPHFMTMREKYSAKQRVRISAMILGGFVVGSILIQDFIPYLLGGVIALAFVLSLISFLRKTPQEISFEVNGLRDPRDEEDSPEEPLVTEEEVSDEESQAYAELLNSLPEDQRKLLLNPKFNGAIAVVDEDDIKSKKKRRLFGK